MRWGEREGSWLRSARLRQRIKARATNSLFGVSAETSALANTFSEEVMLFDPNPPKVLINGTLQ